MVAKPRTIEPETIDRSSRSEVGQADDAATEGDKPLPTVISPQDFYREFTSRPDVRAILKDLAKM